MKPYIIISTAFILTFATLTLSAEAMLNPATTYCKALGYEYQDGFCILPNGQQVPEWDFLEGKVGKEFSYCEKNGYQLKIVKDYEKCLRFLTGECSVCILDNGTEVEVTELMGLNLEETVCGDNNCGFPENYKKCPEDCPSGGIDAYCDGVKDGICDFDCSSEEEDIDCKGLLEETSQVGLGTEEKTKEMGKEKDEEVEKVDEKNQTGQEDININITPGFELFFAILAIFAVWLMKSG